MEIYFSLELSVFFNQLFDSGSEDDVGDEEAGRFSPFVEVVFLVDWLLASRS